ncbi:molybdenum cofactor biosynthesis protein MoaE [Roseinatronobacter sp. NSM]|uniref:molybdenum cofactor biosynthesis protein MoaE n=1 Tax=Roseinatronobacter sp. NSM TaxID=3457785 RepID=UPI004035B441
MQIRVQQDDFDFGDECRHFATGRQDTGAVVTFCGIVRAPDTGILHRMEIEHYPGMTERAIARIAQTAQDRWNLTEGLVIHRYGALRPGERIMMVATASRHRADAFAAADFLMDYLKSRAPFWKKEITDQGADWVAAKDADEAALSRW